MLAGEATAIPQDRSGFAGELRLLVRTRRSAVQARTQAANRIKAFPAEGDDELRARLRGLRKQRIGQACAALEPTGPLRGCWPPRPAHTPRSCWPVMAPAR